MKHSWHWTRKVLALTLAATICGTVPMAGMTTAVAEPAAEEEATALAAYGMATADMVVVRKQPSTSANYWFRIDNGFVCEILDTVTKNDEMWYKVNSTHPTPNGRTYIGYVRASFFRPLTADETAAYLAGGLVSATATPTPTPTPDVTLTMRPSVDDMVGASTDSQFNVGIMTSSTPTPIGSVATPVPDASATTSTGEITASGTNFRLAPSLDAGVIGKLNSGTIVALLSIPDTIDANHWYHIRYNGQEGYVQSNFVRVLTVSATATPGVSAYGTVKLLYDSANLRNAPNGTTKAVWQGRGTVLTVTGVSQSAGGYTWYPVRYGVDNETYYVRDDVVDYTPGTGVTATATPAPGNSGYGYVLTTVGGLNLRLSPTGETIVQIPRNVVLPCIGVPVQPTGSSYVWYYVRYNNMAGYVRGDFVRVCDENGGELGSNATIQPAATPTPVVYSGYVKLIKAGVNLRRTPAGESIGQYDKGLILPIAGATVSSGRYQWYYVRTPDGKTGYMRGDCVMLSDLDGVQVTATPAPTATTTVASYGYIQITKPSTNLRDAVEGETIYQLQNKSVWPLLSSPVTVNGITWYRVAANGYTGFVRGDCAYKLSATQQESYLAGNGIPSETPAPTSSIAQTSYVQTTVDYVNLRQSASRDAKSMAKVRTGTVLTFNATTQAGTSTWYRVVYQGSELWVLGSCVKVMTQAEYDQWVQLNPDAATPRPNAAKGYIVTTSAGVNVRATANGSTILSRVEKGTVLPYYAENIKAGSYTWYQVRLSNGKDGYIRSDFATKSNENGGALPTATPIVTTPPSGSTSTSKPTATYTTLRLGSSGDAVTRLVQELINQGYYTGAVTSSYTSDVQAAVRAFQAANNLTVDGIAGKLTQHALFGTVEPGTADPSDYSFQFYPAEKIDWFTGGIQQLWAKGASYKVYDVQTGIVWWARRWSGANHCDIEPLTAQDTARLCQIYGVSDAQEIWDKNLWQRRPCLVTIGTRTFACSLFGMPHNPDGDTIPDNDMVGQICMHFTNSKGHESGKVDTYHQQAIEYAWLNCPAGHK